MSRKPYPIYIEVKDRYFDTTILCCDPNTRKVWGFWICYKIPTSWSETLISILVSALATQYIESLGYIRLCETFASAVDDRTDRQLVFDDGQKTYATCCNRIFRRAILSPDLKLKV